MCNTTNTYAELKIEYMEENNLFLTDKNELWESGKHCYGIVKISDDVLDIPKNIYPGSKYVIKTDNNLYSIDGMEEYKAAENVEKATVYRDDVFFIAKDGGLWGMGKNEYGTLGNDVGIPKDVPVKIMDNVRDFYHFDTQVMAITRNNELYAWGENTYGCFAQGVRTCGPTKLMDNVIDVADISLKDKDGNTYYNDHKFFVTLNTDSELYLWGIDKDGKHAADDEIPVVDKCIKLSDDVKCFDKFARTLIFIKNDNTLYCMGQNKFNIMGEDTEYTFEPVKIQEDVKEAAIFSDFILILNNSGELTRYYTVYDEYDFNKVGYDKDQPIDNVKHIALPRRDNFSRTAFVIRNDDTVWGMGDNSLNALGLGKDDLKYIYEPVECKFFSDKNNAGSSVSVSDTNNDNSNENKENHLLLPKIIQNGGSFLILLPIALLLILLHKRYGS